MYEKWGLEFIFFLTTNLTESDMKRQYHFVGEEKKLMFKYE